MANLHQPWVTNELFSHLWPEGQEVIIKTHQKIQKNARWSSHNHRLLLSYGSARCCWWSVRVDKETVSAFHLCWLQESAPRSPGASCWLSAGKAEKNLQTLSWAIEASLSKIFQHKIQQYHFGGRYWQRPSGETSENIKNCVFIDSGRETQPTEAQLGIIWGNLQTQINYHSLVREWLIFLKRKYFSSSFTWHWLLLLPVTFKYSSINYKVIRLRFYLWNVFTKTKNLSVCQWCWLQFTFSSRVLIFSLWRPSCWLCSLTAFSSSLMLFSWE